MTRFIPRMLLPTIFILLHVTHGANLKCVLCDELKAIIFSFANSKQVVGNSTDLRTYLEKSPHAFSDTQRGFTISGADKQEANGFYVLRLRVPSKSSTWFEKKIEDGNSFEVCYHPGDSVWRLFENHGNRRYTHYYKVPHITSRMYPPETGWVQGYPSTLMPGFTA